MPGDFPYNSLYAQSCRIHYVFCAWELVLRIQNGGLTTQHDTEKRRESFLIWPNFYLQMGISFNISFNFMFFS